MSACACSPSCGWEPDPADPVHASCVICRNSWERLNEDGHCHGCYTEMLEYVRIAAKTIADRRRRET